MGRYIQLCHAILMTIHSSFQDWDTLYCVYINKSQGGNNNGWTIANMSFHGFIASNCFGLVFSLESMIPKGQICFQKLLEIKCQKFCPTRGDFLSSFNLLYFLLYVEFFVWLALDYSTYK